jgi:hypothetical protein
MSLHNVVAGGVFALALLVLGAPVHSGSRDLSNKAIDPLFASDAPLAITLTAPLSRAKDERDKAAVYAGEIRSEGRTFPLELTLRGNRRLSKKTCAYPPLRVEFEKTAVKETIFEHQSDLKLVVQCRDGAMYADYLRAEYLIYRALNLLTPLSFDVRWVDVAFIDSDRKMKDRAEGAFFVERKSRLAKRNGREVADMPGIRISELDLPAAALLDLFQFVVANPDYSFTTAPPGDECCHNAKLLTGPTPGSYTPLIYDFDSAGAINTKYAVPAANLRIKKVTDRYYMGYCEANDVLKEARARILASRAQVLELFNNDPLLGSSMKSRLINFMTKGFDILSDDARFTKHIINRCR